MSDHCDVLIVGGGLVGTSLALALEHSGLEIAQVEAEPARLAPIDPGSGLDQRHFALAHASVAALAQLGVWPALAAAAHPIRSVEVSSRGAFGAVRLRAGDYGVEALGHTVPAAALGRALAQRSAACRTLIRHAPARLVGLERSADAVRVALETPAGSIALETRLVIAADGTDSAVRGLAGIGSSDHDYGQTALVGALALARDLDGRAYERLSEDGPVALLPLAGQRAGFIWTMASSRVAETLALDDAAFVAALQQHFGWRAGRFRRAGRRQPWPLKLVLADALVAPRVVLVGNAAQTIHPLGAQGFNLGLRDAMQLAEALRDCARAGADPGAPELLARYAARRGPDRAATLDFSDGLTRLAARSGTLADGGRSLALTLVERMPLLKQDLAFALMGYRQSGAA